MTNQKSINTKAIGVSLLVLLIVLYYRFVVLATARVLQNYCWYDQESNKGQVVVDCIACHPFYKMNSQRGYINISTQVHEVASELIYQTECLEYQCKHLSVIDDFKFAHKENQKYLESFGFTKRIYGDGSKKIYFQQQYGHYGFLLRFRYLITKDAAHPIEQLQKPIVTIHSIQNSLIQRILFSALGISVWENVSPLFFFGFLDRIVCTILSAIVIFIMLKQNHCIGICLITDIIWVIASQDIIHPTFIQFLSILLICEQFITKSYVGKSRFYFMNYWHYTLLIGLVYVCGEVNIMIMIYIYIPQILYIFSKLQGLNFQKQSILKLKQATQQHMQIQQQEVIEDV